MRINFDALRAWFNVKRDHGYKYCIAWSEGNSPCMTFTKDLSEARARRATTGGLIGDLVTMQIVY